MQNAADWYRQIAVYWLPVVFLASRDRKADLLGHHAIDRATIITAHSLSHLQSTHVSRVLD